MERKIEMKKEKLKRRPLSKDDGPVTVKALEIMADILPEKQLPKDKDITKELIDKIILKTKEAAQAVNKPYIQLILDIISGVMITGFQDGLVFMEKVFKEDLMRESKESYEILSLISKGFIDLAKVGTDLNFDFIKEIISHSHYDYPIIIIGETGTSKQSIAEEIHNLSKRSKKPFKNINCVALPESLFESELFGYKKGAFTDAKKDKKGFLKVAHEGTVFLDELGKLPKHLQAKLLKAIEEKEYCPLGSENPVKFDVRFIATAQPADLKRQSIIPDLKYRLGFPDYISMPTLKKRLSIEFSLIFIRVLKNVSFSMGIEDKFSLNNETELILKNIDYEGNFRELENILRAALRSASTSERDEILPDDLKNILNKKKSKNKELNTKEEKKSYMHIKLKDILNYAEKKKAEIVEAKIEEVYKNGNDIINALRSEGAIKKQSDYTGFRNKFERVVGKETLKEIRNKCK